MSGPMEPCRLATIDIGTNMVLLLVAETTGTRAFRVLEDRAEITRLGEGVDHRGLLGEGGQGRTLESLREYCGRCQGLGVKEILVGGTSALRDAANAEDFKNRLKRDLGLSLRILSPEEEARYSYLAVYRGLRLEAREVLVVDVGGGSTEFIHGRDGGVIRWASLQMGSVRLTERFLFSDPVGEEEQVRLVRAVDREIEGMLGEWKTKVPFDAIVGVAGTFTTLVAVGKGLARYAPAQVHGSLLARSEVQRQVRLFKGKTLAQRRAIPGLEPKRADVILAGALLIDRIMEFFGTEGVWISDQGIRYGLLYERLDDPVGQPKAGSA